MIIIYYTIFRTSATEETMHLEHIFESGHLFGTIVGWGLFLITSLKFSHLLPFAYDAWLIDRVIDLSTFNERQAKKRQAAIGRLFRYYQFVVKYGDSESVPIILNDFGRLVIRHCAIWGVLMLLSIFFPTVLEVIWFILKITM